MLVFSLQFEYFVLAVAAIISAITWTSIKRWKKFTKERFRPQWIILYACSLQAVWGLSLGFWGKTDIAAWSSFHALPSWLLGCLFMASSTMSYIALMKNKSISWMLPQQGLMMMAAISCLTSVILGHYADGAEYPRFFILRDQLPEILTAVWHTCAIFHRERLRLWSTTIEQLECGKIS